MLMTKTRYRFAGRGLELNIGHGIDPQIARTHKVMTNSEIVQELYQGDSEMNLECQDVQLWGDAQTSRRWHRTKRFMVAAGLESNLRNVLDIGPGGEFGMNLAKAFETENYHYTVGDLDSMSGWYPYPDQSTFDYVTCFEVLEHLMNPEQFLENLKKYCTESTDIYISFPRIPRWLMSDRHFHEFRDIEFRKMVDKAGYRIEAYENFRNRHNWLFYLRGIRPFIRFWVMLFGMSRVHFYLLKVKT